MLETTLGERKYINFLCVFHVQKVGFAPSPELKWSVDGHFGEPPYGKGFKYVLRFVSNF